MAEPLDGPASGPELSPQDLSAWQALDARIRALLPPQYQDSYESVSPESMGSASLRFGADGRVAWDEIWTSFCELALAGGPPHRGRWLAPAPADEVAADDENYQRVVEEIGRGIWMVTRLGVLPRLAPGWVGAVCANKQMAAWLQRAVTAENIAVRRRNETLWLPAGPAFRLEKEIKNVVTALAKTCHYWSYHASSAEQSAALNLAVSEQLLEPAGADEIDAVLDFHGRLEDVCRRLSEATAMRATPAQDAGWISLECADLAMAVWLLRAIVVQDVLARRQENVLYLPAPAGRDVQTWAARLIEAVAQARRLWDVDRAIKARNAIN
jgi:sirohydrochlorin cobaltochelatase